MRKIEARKRDRDRKTQDLQKLISAVDKQNDSRKSLKIDKKTTHHRKRVTVPVRPTRVDPNVIFNYLFIYNLIKMLISRTLKLPLLNFRTLKIVVYLHVHKE